MKLYSTLLSPFAARVRCAVYAKRLPVDIVEAPSDWRGSAAFRAINPLGKIPVLELEDGLVIPESGIIVEYLEDAFPSPSLRPGSAEEIARMRLVAQVAELYVLQEILPIFRLLDAAPRSDAAIEAQIAKLKWGIGQLESLLPRGGYAYGEKLSLADCMMTPVRFVIGGLIRFAGRPDLLDGAPDLAAYAGFAEKEPVLGRVWQEMEAGYERLMAARSAS